MSVQSHLDKLGYQCKDKVTGLKGVITSISFDLYGCIQALVHLGLDKEGKPKELHWYDIARLEIKSKNPVMEVPDFVTGPVAEGLKGPAEKPSMRSMESLISSPECKG